MIERRVDHDVYSLRIRRSHEIAERLHGAWSRICIAQLRHDLEEVFHCVGTAGVVGLAVYVFSTVFPTRMNGLKPQPIGAHSLEVVEIPTIFIVQVLERAARREAIARGIHGEGIEFVHDGLARRNGTDHYGMVSFAVACVPMPNVGIVF